MYAFTDNGDYIQLVTDGTRTLQIKKKYIKMRVSGDLCIINFHDKERRDNTYTLRIDWNDVTAPVVTSATDLMNQLDAFIGGGGGGVASVTDDGNGVVSVDNTDPANPIIEFNGAFVESVSSDTTAYTSIDNTDPVNPITGLGNKSKAAINVFNHIHFI